MPQRASVTVSPSSSRIGRSTPWVEGCWGPMLTTTRSSAEEPSPWVVQTQSWPVKVKALARQVSLGCAYEPSAQPDHAEASGCPRRCSPEERSGGGEEGRGVTSAVAPALVRKRNRAALV